MRVVKQIGSFVDRTLATVSCILLYVSMRVSDFICHFPGLIISQNTRKAAMRAAKESVKNKKVNGKAATYFEL